MDDVTFAETALAILRAEFGWVLRSVKNAAYQAERSGTEPDVPVRRVAVVRAFETAGVLSPTDASRWREWFEEASRPLAPQVVGDELRRSIDEYLGGLVAAAHEPSDGSDAWLGAQAAWNDLQAAGVIDDDEVDRWMRKLRGEPSEGPERTASRAMPREEFLPDRPIRSVVGPPLRRRGVRLIAVDLFEGGVGVRLDLTRRGRDLDGAFRPLPDEVEPNEPLALDSASRISISDDIGTDYRSSGAGGHRVAPTIDAPLWQRWAAYATPAVPPDARRLSVSWRGVSFEVAL
jgi:hypothetical protein